MMLWEFVCHFHIDIYVTGSKGAFVWHKKWTEYFFINLNGQEPIVVNGPPPVEKLKKCLEQFTVSGRMLEEDEEGLSTATVLLSYHY